MIEHERRGDPLPRGDLFLGVRVGGDATENREIEASPRLGALAPAELHHRRAARAHPRRGEIRIAIDEHRDRGDAAGDHLDQRPRPLSRHRARRGRVLDEADRRGAGRDRRDEIFLARDPADLHPRHDEISLHSLRLLSESGSLFSGVGRASHAAT